MAAEQHDPRVQRVVDAGSRAGVEVRARRFPEGTHTAEDAAAGDRLHARTDREDARVRRR